MAKNPKTKNIIKRTAQHMPVRLMQADRQFLRDLSVVQIIDTNLADKYHYAHLKNGSTRSLNRLEKAGILTSSLLRVRGNVTRTYTFASVDIARAFGGDVPVIGARRSDLHELVTSRLYFALDRPDDFRLAKRFDATDSLLCGGIQPDAMFTDQHGETIFVEADSGHYTQRQIFKKQRAWQGVSQVWGQPDNIVSTVVPTGNDITVLKL